MIVFRKKNYQAGVFYYRLRTLNNKGLRQEEWWDITEIRITTNCPLLGRSNEEAKSRSEILEFEKITEAEWDAAMKQFLDLINSKKPLDRLELPF